MKIPKKFDLKKEKKKKKGEVLIGVQSFCFENFELTKLLKILRRFDFFKKIKLLIDIFTIL